MHGSAAQPSPPSTCPGETAITLSQQLPTDTVQDEAQARGDKDDGHSYDDPEIVPPPIHRSGALRRMETEERDMSRGIRRGGVGAVVYHVTGGIPLLRGSGRRWLGQTLPISSWETPGKACPPVQHGGGVAGLHFPGQS